jgi:hypothetical protein
MFPNEQQAFDELKARVENLERLIRPCIYIGCDQPGVVHRIAGSLCLDHLNQVQSAGV